MAVFVAAENTIVPSFQSCISQPASQQGTEATQDKALAISGAVKVQILCSMHLVDRHAGFFAALATLAIASFTLTLWRATHKLWLTSEKTAERQLRAYVFPKDIIITNLNSDPTVTITFKNCGQTPAYDKVVWASMAVAVFPLEEEPKPPETGPTESIAHVGPGMETHSFVKPDVPITTDEINGIQSGKAALYLCGAVNYTDAFGKRRFSRFAAYRGGDAPDFTDGPMAIYKKWNEAN